MRDSCFLGDLTATSMFAGQMYGRCTADVWQMQKETSCNGQFGSSPKVKFCVLPVHRMDDRSVVEKDIQKLRHLTVRPNL